MKQTDISLHTRQALAASLKKLMEHKPLSKITVREICEDCSINRKTFYYHFEDIFDLLKWMLEQETLEVMKKYDLMEEYEEIIGFIIDYVDENNHILNCAYDAMGREGMKRFFFSHFDGVVSDLIGNHEKRLSLKLDESYRQFLCQFYTSALSSMLIDWFRDKSTFTREEIIEYLSLTIRSALPSAMLERTVNYPGTISSQ